MPVGFERDEVSHYFFAAVCGPPGRPRRPRGAHASSDSNRECAAAEPLGRRCASGDRLGSSFIGFQPGMRRCGAALSEPASFEGARGPSGSPRARRARAIRRGTVHLFRGAPRRSPAELARSAAARSRRRRGGAVATPDARAGEPRDPRPIRAPLGWGHVSPCRDRGKCLDCRPGPPRTPLDRLDSVGRLLVRFESPGFKNRRLEETDRRCA